MMSPRLGRFLALPLCFTLAACGLGSSIDSTVQDTLGTSTPVAAVNGGVAVGDEPLAVSAGTAILKEGGSAADAVTAMFFALTATYPVSAGLGGGGICLVAQPGQQVREYDFLPRAARGGGPYAVPGAVAGFYAMQKASGTLPWQRTVAPGETLAAAGFSISHALAQRLGGAVALLRQDRTLAAQFLDSSGGLKPEGAMASNTALSETLSAIRLSGADGFYKGAVAAMLAQNGLTLADLAAYQPEQAAPRAIAEAGLAMTPPGPQTGAGVFAAALAASAPASGDPEAAVVAGVRQALARFNITSLPQDLGATGFAAVDASGQAAACAVTMNGPFGAGRTAGDSGVTYAAAPDAQAGGSSVFLTPLMLRDGSGRVMLAGAGAGGPNGTAAILYAALKLASGRQLGQPGDLRSTGVAPFATVNVVSCGTGACIPLADPGGSGLGAASNMIANGSSK